MIKKALGTFIGFTGFVASIDTVLNDQNPIRTIALWSIVGFAIVLLSVLAVPEALRKYRAQRSLPTESDLDDRCSGYQVAQAARSEIHWIAELEASVYPRADAISEQVLREWYTANPSGFSIIKEPSGEPVGHLDILPLRPSTLDAFCKGNIVESEIRGDSLYSEQERHLITVLYVESVILRPERPQRSASALMCVLKNLPTLVERVADPNTLDKVYAIAATPRW